MSEYNPAADPDIAIAPTPTPAPTPLAPVTTGEGYDKALGSERAARKAQEKEIATLKALISDKERQLEQTNQTLEQKYASELERDRSALQAQVDAAIAERDAKLQQESEARMTAEQRLQMIENQQLASRIGSEFGNTFAPLLNNPNPQRLEAYMSLIADDLTVDNQGNPALIVRRDEYGRAAELAPVSAAIGYFQNIFPEDFKAPEQQKTGGGARNLAGGSNTFRDTTQSLELPPMGQITPEQFLKNRDAIAKGDFKVVK